jgi:hypothetical protein
MEAATRPPAADSPSTEHEKELACLLEAAEAYAFKPLDPTAWALRLSSVTLRRIHWNKRIFLVLLHG